MTTEAKAKAKDLTFEAKAKAEDLTSEAKAKDKLTWPRGASRPRPWPRGLHLCFTYYQGAVKVTEVGDFLYFFIRSEMSTKSIISVTTALYATGHEEDR